MPVVLTFFSSPTPREGLAGLRFLSIAVDTLGFEGAATAFAIASSLFVSIYFCNLLKLRRDQNMLPYEFHIENLLIRID